MTGDQSDLMAEYRRATAPERRAIIRADFEVIEPYLYSNYHIVGQHDEYTVIAGHDDAGLTLEAQLTRLATGLYFGREIPGVTATTGARNFEGDR